MIPKKDFGNEKKNRDLNLYLYYMSPGIFSVWMWLEFQNLNIPETIIKEKWSSDLKV